MIKFIEDSNNPNSIESISRSKDESSKEKARNSANSISNINSPTYKLDSIIGDSEIKDTKNLINDLRFNKSNENSDFETNKQFQESGEVESDGSFSLLK